jgi:hypothetical protein
MIESFFDYYEGTRRVTVGRPGAGFYVELYEHAAYKAMENAVRAMTQVNMSASGQAGMRGDVPRYQQLSILAHIKEWNLTGPDGQVMPITEESVRRLPLTVTNQLWQIVQNELDAQPTAEEKARFPVADGVGDPSWEQGTGGVSAVLDGARRVEGTGAELGELH